MKKKNENSDPVLRDAIKSLENKYGEGVVLRMSDTPTNVKSLSTGLYSLDNLLGCGGLPQGRMIEVFGHESGGKSSLCLFLAGQIQKQGGKVVYLDVEQSYDKRYAGILGVNTDDLIVSQPSTLEETFDILRAFVATNAIDFIVIDSVASLIPKQDLEEGALEKETMAVKARLMSKFLPVVVSEIAKSKSIVAFINQTRSNVGVYYGPKDTTPGGKALKFYSSVRIQVAKGESLMRGKDPAGNVMKIKAVKNKVGPPFRECTVNMYYDQGIDLVTDVLNVAVERGIIERAGNTYKFGDQKLGVGKEAAHEFLRTNPQTYQAIYTALEKPIDKELKEE